MKKELTHPAYGMVSFRRINGYNGHMFGSNVECDRFIELEIKNGVEIFDDSYHTYSTTHSRPLIRVVLTPAQFSELITSMNINEGVPCTIEQINGEKVEKIPDDVHVNELDEQKAEYRSRINGTLSSIKSMRKELADMFNDKSKKTLNKDDKQAMLNIFDRAITDMQSNIPFFMEIFQETTDKIVAHAKAEIDATIMHCFTEAGLKALGENFSNVKGETKMIENHGNNR